jgi:hypothetical protein
MGGALLRMPSPSSPPPCEHLLPREAGVHPHFHGLQTPFLQPPSMQHAFLFFLRRQGLHRRRSGAGPAPRRRRPLPQATRWTSSSGPPPATASQVPGPSPALRFPVLAGAEASRRGFATLSGRARFARTGGDSAARGVASFVSVRRKDMLLWLGGAVVVVAREGRETRCGG